MNDIKLIYQTDIKLVFDNDCLTSFIWIKRIDILTNLYSGRMFVPQEVVDEFNFLKRYSKYKWVYEDLLDIINKNIFKIIDINSNNPAFYEYNKLRNKDKGKGESAALAIAKNMDNYTACNNLKDIRPLIDNNEINNLLTFDILFEYYHKTGKPIKRIVTVITQMKNKKRKLPNIIFKNYIEDNYNNI